MPDLVFLSPWWLVGFVALPFLWLTGRFQRKRAQGPIAAHLSQIATKPTGSLTITVWIVAWSLGLIALASPSWQTSSRPIFSTQHNRVLIMDMSQSLYAKDISPSRLQQAKYKAMDLLPMWKEGSTSLIAYAGDAYILSPLTSDSKTLSNLVANLSPELMPYQGAYLPNAIRLALAQLAKGDTVEGDIVVISDDVDDQELSESLQLLKGKQVRVSVLAVATPDGAPIPLPDGRLLSDTAGQIVVARSNLLNMANLAQKTSGSFAPIQFGNQDVAQIAALTQTSNTMMDHKEQADQRSDVRENGGYWLVPILLLLALPLFRRGDIWMMALVLIPILTTPQVEASPFLNSDQQGKALFDQQDYAAAAKTFEDTNWRGAAAYQAGEYDLAAQQFAQSQSAESLYNLGNALAQNGQYDDALEAYQKALEKNPNLKQAQANRQVVEKA
ncbi:TPA: VWA domain-containing protein, partial [Vibrio vulnificus]|nr:VWA domain-containing protein [Vibrio vulnificus]